MSKSTEDSYFPIDEFSKYFSTLEPIVNGIASLLIPGETLKFEYNSGTVLIIIK